jgi:phage gp45-like
MINYIKSLIKMARSGVTSDTGNRRLIDVTYQGKTMKALDLTPYGFFHHVPENGLAIVFAQNGQDSNGIAIVDDPDGRTIKNTTEGECGLQNDLTGAYVYLQANGDVKIYTPNKVVIDANGTTFEMSESGLDVTNGDVTADGISLKTHVHSGVTPGGSNTGGPV